MILWLVFIACELIRNWILIVPLKTRPHYGYSALIRFGFGAIFLFKAHPEFDPVGDPTTIFPTVNYAAYLASSFYILFDPILNLLRGLPWDYQGKNSGELDKLPDGKYYLLKAGSLVVLILTSILLYAR